MTPKQKEVIDSLPREFVIQCGGHIRHPAHQNSWGICNCPLEVLGKIKNKTTIVAQLIGMELDLTFDETREIMKAADYNNYLNLGEAIKEIRQYMIDTIVIKETI